jgi:hypothetical protein
MFKCSCEYFLLVSNCLHKSVGVLDGDSHLKQIFAENFFRSLMLCSLSKQEFDDGDADFSFLAIKLLISAKFVDLFIIEGLTCDLLYDLDEYEFKLNSRDTV